MLAAYTKRIKNANYFMLGIVAPMWPSTGLRLIEVKPVAMDRYGGRVTLVYSVTSHPNPRSGPYRCSSIITGPASVNRAHHKILGPVRESSRVGIITISLNLA
jgi:hypothetical protein